MISIRPTCVYAFQTGLYEVENPPARPATAEPVVSASATPVSLVDLAVAAEDLLSYDDLLSPNGKKSLKTQV